MATKLVNGQRVEVPAEQLTELQTEWAANANSIGVPTEVTKVQFVRAMRQLGIWDSYQATIEADPDWPYITQMPRNNTTLNASANAVLGEQTAQALLDQVFTLGATL